MKFNPPTTWHYPGHGSCFRVIPSAKMPGLWFYDCWTWTKTMRPSLLLDTMRETTSRWHQPNGRERKSKKLGHWQRPGSNWAAGPIIPSLSAMWTPTFTHCLCQFEWYFVTCSPKHPLAHDSEHECLLHISDLRVSSLGWPRVLDMCSWSCYCLLNLFHPNLDLRIYTSTW